MIKHLRAGQAFESIKRGTTMRLNTLIQIHAARIGLAASLLAGLPINMKP